MATSAVDGMMLLMKKLGGLILVLLGCLGVGSGFGTDSMALVAVGLSLLPLASSFSCSKSSDVILADPPRSQELVKRWQDVFLGDLTAIQTFNKTRHSIRPQPSRNPTFGLPTPLRRASAGGEPARRQRHGARCAVGHRQPT
jgi:hypothetical protein